MREGQAIVAVEGLTKRYHSRRRGEVEAVGGISFAVERGEIVGLLGPNGAGKTTTIKCLCGLVRPSSGRIVVDGEDAVGSPRRAAAKLAAVLEGNRNIYWRLTPPENLEYFAALNGIARGSIRPLIDELLDRFGLAEVRGAEARTLSRGMQQKLAVACAFVKQTPILLLDEPTLGLDVETSLELRAMLRSMAADAGRTILLSSHDMDVVQDVCERVVIIDRGRIVTQDRIANLIELFGAKAYRFVVRGPLEASRTDALTAVFPGLRVEAEGGSTRLDVELLDPARLYDFIDALRSAGCEIESIDRMEPHLEEIFLRIVRGETR